MDNIIKCKRCQKTIIAENYTDHVCSPYLKQVKEIPIDYYFEGEKDENGDLVIMVMCMNGTMLRLCKCLHNPPHQPKVNTINTTDKETEPG